MKQSIVHVALVVKDYDEAIAFYTQKLHFELIEDTYQPEQDKRWVVVSPPGSQGTTLLLARASKPEQEPFVGNQTGGRVFLFLNTDDFWRDYNEMRSKGIKFVQGAEETRIWYGGGIRGFIWQSLGPARVKSRPSNCQTSRITVYGRRLFWIANQSNPGGHS